MISNNQIAMNVSNKASLKISFHSICKLLESIACSKTKLEKTNRLESFIHHWSTKIAPQVTELTTDLYPGLYRASLYNFLRIILPQLDKERPSYGLRATALARVYRILLHLSPISKDALKLKHFKSNPSTSSCYIGDFADALYEVLQNRSSDNNKISLFEANEKLTQIAKSRTVTEKFQVFRYILQKCSPLEQKWIARIITDHKIKLGISQTLLLELLHPVSNLLLPTSTSILNLCGSLVCFTPNQTYTEEKLASMDIENNIKLDCPFIPMLCQRANNVDHVMQLYENISTTSSVSCLSVLETKYDGERVQIHKNGTKYRYWSRSGLEWTQTYGEDANVIDTGTLTSRLHAKGHSFAHDVQTCILDGEMLGYNFDNGKFVLKATGFDVKKPVSLDSDIIACSLPKKPNILPVFIAFDLLYLNGKDLSKESVINRKKALAKLFKLDDSTLFLPNSELIPRKPYEIVRGALYMAQFRVISISKEAIESNFNAILSRKEEGLVVKNSDSHYQPAKRNKGGWFKLKPDYDAGMMDDFDCAIVGGDFSQTQSQTLNPTGITVVVNQFLCALLTQPINLSSTKLCDNSFISFCKVSTGFTNEKLIELNNLLRPHWITFESRKSHPSWLALGQEKADCYVHPSKSVVLQIRGAELVKTSSYASRLTLRFPRVIEIRNQSKEWYESMTIEDLNRLNKETYGKLTRPKLAKRPRLDFGISDESEEDISLNKNELSDEDEVEFALLENQAESSLNNRLIPLAFQRKGSKFTRVSEKRSDSVFGKVHIQPNRKRGKMHLPVASQFMTTLTDVPIDLLLKGKDVPDGIFTKLEFCVMLSNAAISCGLKHKVELAIHENGGRIVMNPLSTTDFVIADLPDEKNPPIFRVENLIKATENGSASSRENAFDIFKPSWIFRSIEQGKRTTPIRSEVICARISTKKNIANYQNLKECPADRFGDSFTEQMTSESLRYILKSIDVIDKVLEKKELKNGPLENISIVKMTQEEAQEFAQENNINCILTGPLHMCRILILNIALSRAVRECVNLEANISALAAKFLGANVVKAETGESFHLIQKSSETQTFANILSLLKSEYSVTHVCVHFEHDYHKESADQLEEKLRNSIRSEFLKIKQKVPYLLRYSWIHKCLEQWSWVSENVYIY